MTISEKTKKGREAQRSGVHGYEMLGGYEAELLAELFPQHAALIRRGFSALTPGGEEAELAKYRNRSIQAATQSGKSAAALANWSGLGSGAQGAAINDAMFNSQNDIGAFMQYLQSPEYYSGAAQASAGMMAPNILANSLAMSGQLRQNNPPKPKKQSLLGGIVGTAAQLYGMGAFNGLSGGGNGGGRRSAFGAL